MPIDKPKERVKTRSQTVLRRSISKHQNASASFSKRTTNGDSKSLIPEPKINIKHVKLLKSKKKNAFKTVA